ncbi:MAG: ABC transporter permease subunit [Pseudomonadales bacterium]|nr:ABC transporter permease subunit [Pseudomonadales bacterium]
MIRLNPLTRRKLQRFRGIRRGWWSFVALITLLGLSFVAELLVNDRALAVRHDGQWHFPVYGDVELGATYGLTGTAARTPVDYRALAETFAARGGDDRVILPPVPWGPYANDVRDGIIRAEPPDASRAHWLGTDTTGRDILARLVYGFRTAMLFALAYTAATFAIGVGVGCAMGWFGGLFDLLFQRLIEIWSNIPFLYMVIIVFSVIPGTFDIPTRIGILLLIMVGFSWTGLTYYMRTETYKEKARDYTAAALVLGASTPRIIFRHILPNSISTMVTFLPFTVVSAITAITALDFLGWGLPPPTPSIGELLKQGTANLTTAPWIVTSAFAALVFILTLVTFVGEAIREAFDPRRFTLYR